MAPGIPSLRDHLNLMYRAHRCVSGSTKTSELQWQLYYGSSEYQHSKDALRYTQHYGYVSGYGR